MEEEKTCRTCRRLQENGFCELVSAREVEECVSNGLSHWSSIYNSQYEINLDNVDNIN